MHPSSAPAPVLELTMPTNPTSSFHRTTLLLHILSRFDTPKSAVSPLLCPAPNTALHAARPRHLLSCASATVMRWPAPCGQLGLTPGACWVGYVSKRVGGVLNHKIDKVEGTRAVSALLAWAGQSYNTGLGLATKAMPLQLLVCTEPHTVWCLSSYHAPRERVCRWADEPLAPSWS